MQRTQIQLTAEQMRTLKEVASREGVSLAAVIRSAVDQFGARQAVATRADRQRRALAAVGRFASGRSDVSKRHDRHLAEAFAR
jgi:hypothetical protein